MDDIAVLQLMLTNGLGTKTLNRLLYRLSAEERKPADAVAESPGELSYRYGLNPAIAERIDLVREEAVSLAKQLSQNGISWIDAGCSEYPDRLSAVLGEEAPPVLFVRGDVSLLNRKCVGFCGVRKASKRGLAMAANLSNRLAVQRINIVSGYAPGIDRASHRAALEAGGATIFVLAEGIFHFRNKQRIASLLSDSNHLIVSQFLPRTAWLSYNAIQRNRTICALSHAVVLVEAGLSGGTYSSGVAALKLGRPLFAVEFDRPLSSATGNPYFINRGARSILESSNPDIGELLRAVELDRGDNPYPQQPSLFG